MSHAHQHPGLQAELDAHISDSSAAHAASMSDTTRKSPCAEPGTADVILIPEIEWDMQKVCEKIMDRDAAGRRFSIVVVAEGSKPKGGMESIIGASLPGQDRRLGGIAEQSIWRLYQHIPQGKAGAQRRIVSTRQCNQGSA